MKYAFSLAAILASAVALPHSARDASCPIDLNGDYAAPALIVPINSASPDTAYGTQYVATISNTEDTLFQFNLPSSYAGKTCSLILTFPSSANVQSFSGDGLLNTALMQDQVTLSTTWNSAGPVQTDNGNVTVAEGNGYSLSTFPCPAGTQLTYKMASADGNTNLDFFETTQAPPVGLWVRAC